MDRQAPIWVPFRKTTRRAGCSAGSASMMSRRYGLRDVRQGQDQDLDQRSDEARLLSTRFRCRPEARLRTHSICRYLDIKKLGRIDGIGQRITGDRTGQSSKRGTGWDYLHVAIDDASRRRRKRSRGLGPQAPAGPGQSPGLAVSLPVPAAADLGQAVGAQGRTGRWQPWSTLSRGRFPSVRWGAR